LRAAAWHFIPLLILTALLCADEVIPKTQSQSTTNMAVTPIRIGVAGLVHGHVLGFFEKYQHSPAIQIVGIAERNQELCSKTASDYSLDHSLFYGDLEEMIQKTRPQAVVTYTNTYDHRKVVEICARHGIPVMMEKPLAVSLEDALAIEKAAKDGKISAIVNYETTWYRSNMAVYDLVHENVLGDVRKIVAHDGHRGPKEIGVGPEFLSWLTDPKLNGGGALFDFGCYGADLATWLMDGQHPLTVTAVTQQIKPDVYPLVDDGATIIVTYPKAQAIFQASWNWPFDRKDLEVYGQTGYAVTVKRDDVRVRREGQNQEEQVAARSIEPPNDDPINYLRAVVLNGLKPQGPSSLETNITVMEILTAARDSARSGKTIRLPAAR
jgi:predicted dehydrogenase